MERRPAECMSVMLKFGEGEMHLNMDSHKKRVRFGKSSNEGPVTLDAYLNIGDEKKRSRPLDWDEILNKEEKRDKMIRKEDGKRQKRAVRQLREIVGRLGKGPFDYIRRKQYLSKDRLACAGDTTNFEDLMPLERKKRLERKKSKIQVTPEIPDEILLYARESNTDEMDNDAGPSYFMPGSMDGRKIESMQACENVEEEVPKYPVNRRPTMRTLSQAPQDEINDW
ncbi:hypothetical protein K3495_g16678, partial [Podosphaera aphanis]